MSSILLTASDEAGKVMMAASQLSPEFNAEKQPYARFDEGITRFDMIIDDPEALDVAVDLLARENNASQSEIVWPVGEGPFAQAVRRVAIDNAAIRLGKPYFVPLSDNFDRAAVAYHRNEAAGVRLHEPFELEPAFPRLNQALGEAACYFKQKVSRKSKQIETVPASYSGLLVEELEPAE